MGKLLLYILLAVVLITTAMFWPVLEALLGLLLFGASLIEFICWLRKPGLPET